MIEQPLPLTRDQVAVLRMATLVTFSHRIGQASIGAYLNVRGHPVTRRTRELFPLLSEVDPDESAITERKREISVHSAIGGYELDGYGMWHVSAKDRQASCFYMLHGAQ